MNQVKRLAITGANGYLGQNTIKEAIKSGWQVNAIVRREEVIKLVKDLGANPFIVKNFNIEQFEAAFKGCKAIVHFANVVCGSSEVFEKINVNGLKKIIEAAIKQNVSRIIYPSGLGVDKVGIKEWANNEYFRSKRKAEELLFESGISYIIFRPSYILGPSDELIPEIIEQISDGVVLVAGDGKVPMQPIYLKDAVKAFLGAADGIGENNQIYNLVGPKVMDMNKLVDLIFSKIKQLGINIPKPEIKYLSYEEAPEKLEICKEMVDVMKCDLILDGNLTAKALNFELSPINNAIEAAVFDQLKPKINNSEKQALVLLSGGIDSTTALFWAIDKGYKVTALSINYRYRPKKEKEATKQITQITGVKLIEVETPFLAQATDLLFEGYPVVSALNAPEGFIPFRNLLFYSIAAFFAEINGFKYIIGGHTVDDPRLFPDSKLSFFKALEKLILISKHKQDFSKLKFLFPLAKFDKIEILKLSKRLNVPLEITWSCYGDFEEPCGKCVPCLNRNKALKDLEKRGI